MSYVDWLKLYSTVVDGKKGVCPECGKNNIQFKLAGRAEDRMGYGIVWCENCRSGIRLSRIKIPEGVDFVLMDKAESEFAQIDSIKFIDDEY